MSEIDADIRAERAARAGAQSKGDFGRALDQELYGTEDRSKYVTELADDGMQDDETEQITSSDVFLRAAEIAKRAQQQHAREAENAQANDAEILKEYAAAGGSGMANTRISDRDNEYKRKHRQKMALSPERAPGQRSYGEVLQEQQLAREKDDLERKLARQQQDKGLLHRAATQSGSSSSNTQPQSTVGEDDSASQRGPSKRRRWEDADGGNAQLNDGASTVSAHTGRVSETTGPRSVVAAHAGQWAETPLVASGAGTVGHHAPARAAAGAADATPLVSAGGKWDDDGDSVIVQQPVAGGSKRRSRWDETPAHTSALGGTAGGGGGGGGGGGVAATPMVGMAGLAGATPLVGAGGFMGATPLVGSGGFGATPLVSSGGALALGVGTSLAAAQAKYEADVEARNRPLTDEELDAVLPSKGYKLLEPPSGYVPIRTPARKLMSAPTPSISAAGLGGAPAGFSFGHTQSKDSYGVPLTGVGEGSSDVPFVKPEDAQFFSSLLEDSRPDAELSAEEVVERRIASLLLRIKNGTPPQRKTALRSLTDNARTFGAGPLFNAILPLLMSPSLEDQERHVLVKVVDRLLFRLDDAVRPYAHKILVVVEPMLIDEDYYARIEGRELIANLAKAAGLATMIAVMRPDLDNADEYVRNTTARAFAVVATALGVPALLPFLKAVCGSKKSWQARHTGAKIVQQTAILMGCAVLPHLKGLVSIVAPALVDEQQKCRIMAGLAIASLAEAAHPYGIEAFDEVLRPLWKGLKTHRGKALSAFLKAVGFIIPLMEPSYAAYYTKEVMPTLVREFGSPDEEMKRIVLRVVQQTCACEGVTAAYLRTDVLPDFFRAFWQRKLALDKRSAKAVVDTTHALAQRVGAADVLSRVVDGLKDESEPYRRLVAEGVERVLSSLGAGDVPARLEEQLMDGALYAFQEQASEVEAENKVILSMFAVLVAALGTKTKPYLPQIAGTIKWRLNNKSHIVRMLAADLCARVAPVMKACHEDGLLGHLGVVLYECLGEEYPDVLGSLLGGLRSIVAVIGMEHMTPPIRDLLPRLTPILKNRHEKVQEACIDLVGRIADRGAAHVSAREWMRICFELLEMLRAPRKAIRRAAVNTFGYIAKAIGPQDVLHTLLNNLKVQERTNRVCTTVAIAIVAETCAPFTVLPALMNEYRTPDMNVQNGVLKALSFMAEYIGPMARDYVYALAPLLEDALIDRDAVHRQIAATAVKHLALGVQGLGCEDALTHLLNYIWPNILETSPHVIGAVLGAVEALRVSLGPAPFMGYLMQGLFHPARRVREVYWRLYNNAYVYAADSLTPLYPRIPGEEAKGPDPVEEPEAAKVWAAGQGKRAIYGPGTVGVPVPPEATRYDRTYLQVFI